MSVDHWQQGFGQKGQSQLLDFEPKSPISLNVQDLMSRAISTITGEVLISFPKRQ